MKTLSTLLFLFLLAIATFAQTAPTVRRVNPDPSITGINVYNTLQAAHDAAVGGDILIVEPGTPPLSTSASVGNLNCIKTLTIYGRGYFLDKNASYATLSNASYNCNVGTITINSNNCRLSGLTITGYININGGVNGITITKNNIYGIDVYTSAGNPVSNLTISQNYISNYFYINNTSSDASVSNVTISNNQMNYVHTSQYTSNVIINQNTIGYVSTTYNCLFTNNIFVNPNQSINNGNTINTSYNYNVFTGTFSNTTGVGTNNIVVANLTSQFNSNTNGSADNNYRVQNGSVLLTAGSTGGQVGMFGGSTPYVQYGIPAVPVVTKFFNTGLGNATTPITATVSANSNN
jgi:hypothetical protein